VFFRQELDTFIAFIGLILFLIGLYVWLGLAAPLMVLGLVMMYIGARFELAPGSEHEPDQTTPTA
jgi:fatty acid desaturase